MPRMTGQQCLLKPEPENAYLLGHLGSARTHLDMGARSLLPYLGLTVHADKQVEWPEEDLTSTRLFTLSLGSHVGQSTMRINQKHGYSDKAKLRILSHKQVYIKTSSLSGI